MILSIKEFDLISQNPSSHFYPKIVESSHRNDSDCMMHGSFIISDVAIINWSAKERVKDSVADYQIFITGFCRNSNQIIFRAKCSCVNISRIYLDLGEASVIDYFLTDTEWADICHEVFSIDPVHDDYDLVDSEELHDKLVDQMNSKFKTNYTCINEFPDVVLIDFIQKMPGRKIANTAEIMKAVMASLYDAGHGPNLLMALRPSPLQYCIPEKYWDVFGLKRFDLSDRLGHTDKLKRLYASQGFTAFEEKSARKSGKWSVPDTEPPFMFSMIELH